MQTWFSKLDDPSRDVYERRYRLFGAVGNLMLTIWLIVALLVDGYSGRIAFFAVCDVVLAAIMVLSLRAGKAQAGAVISAIGLVFLMLPYAFLYNGGINAGAPNWCIIASVLVTLALRGKLRIILLVSDILVTIACYVLTWMRPDLVDSFTAASAYADSLMLLIITGVIISIMFLFQQHMWNQERERMEEQRQEILDLNTAQNRFFSNMSHEIRTPVNTILGLNEMILREEVSDEVAEDAQEVQSAGKMLLHLINDILDMSKLESGRMELTCATYSLAELLTDVVGMMAIHAKQKDLAFHVEVDPRAPASLYGDEMRIKQVLVNVLNNAIKYTAKGAVSLTVQGKRRDDGACTLSFSISDTGSGIKKESIPYLFTAFKRVESDHAGHIEGTGLGLAIVKQLVDLMGGTISVNSVYTKGSTFVIEIPQSEASAEPIGDLEGEMRRSLNLRHGYRQLFEAPDARVLVIDDNAANIMVVKKLLRETHMRIDTAESGDEALRMTLRTAYDLIFMDHLMPGMDGVSCLRHLRQQTGGMSKDAKAIALTANAGPENALLYAKEGFDGYLEKPCSGEVLERECLRLLPPELVQLTSTVDSDVETGISWKRGGANKVEVAVTTDSIADLPERDVRRFGLGVIPHEVRTSRGLFQDGVEIEGSGMLRYLGEGNGDVEVLPPSVAAYEAFFAEQLSRANHVVHVSVSGDMMGNAYAMAVEAARAFNNVTVVDSGHVSCGEGMVALEAARLVREGLASSQIVECLDEFKGHVHTYLVVDDAEHLMRSGLIGRRMAKLLTSLMMRPVLRDEGGRVKVVGVCFGSREHAWRSFIARQMRTMSFIDRSKLFVSYVGLSQKDQNMVAAELERRGHFEAITFQQASPAVAVSCGSGTLGLSYHDAR